MMTILLLLPVWTKFYQKFGAKFHIRIHGRTLRETFFFGGTAVWKLRDEGAEPQQEANNAKDAEKHQLVSGRRAPRGDYFLGERRGRLGPESTVNNDRLAG